MLLDRFFQRNNGFFLRFFFIIKNNAVFKCVSFENVPMPIWSSIQKHMIIRMKENESFAVLKMKVKPWYSEKYYGNKVISKQAWANSQV